MELNIVKGILHKTRLGEDLVISSDSYNLANASFKVRYFEFIVPTKASYIWSCTLPDPGVWIATHKYSEIELLNVSFTNTASGKLVLTILQPNITDRIVNRLILSNTGGAWGSFVINPGGSVKLKSVKGAPGRLKRWYWMLTMAIGDVST